MNNVVTSDLKDFGMLELCKAKELINAMEKGQIPEEFYHDEIHICLNKNSGCVFLSNSEYEVAMINPETDKLEMFYSSPYEGHEGFFDYLSEIYDDMHEEDREWFDDIKEHRITEQKED